jgi:LacI family transcriptional regulator
MSPATVRRITLRDIAREAGVATGTVSMVLNHSPRVAQATRSHVLHVIHDLGYVPDRGAGALRSRRSHLVGVSVCDLMDPVVAEVTAALQQTLAGLGLLSIVGSCAESVNRQRQFLDKLREYNVEGLLLTPATGTPKAQIARLLDWAVPLVQVARYVPGMPTDHVGSDHRRGAAMATEHLLALGHRRIAFIGIDQRSVAARECLDGFVTALQAGGGEPVDPHLAGAAATREAGHQATLALLERADPPTALVCVNARVGLGGLLALRQRGIEPGRSCAVVGLDDMAEAALCDPPLTVIAFDEARIGQAAGQLLADRIANPARTIEHLVLQPRLIVRSSCGARRPGVRLDQARLNGSEPDECITSARAGRASVSSCSRAPGRPAP